MAARLLKVLMLGWEFPPQITGGLGTACEGLTRSLAKRETLVHFLMPHLYGNENAAHLHLYDVEKVSATRTTLSFPPLPGAGSKLPEISFPDAVSEFTHEITSEGRTFFYKIPSRLQPYLRPKEMHTGIAGSGVSSTATSSFRNSRSSFGPLPGGVLAPPAVFLEPHAETTASVPHYGDRLFDEVQRYCNRALRTASGIDFDLIHAHDWMTYPAALLIASYSHRPCVLHVHSLESDRSGDFKNEQIARIESESLHAADSIIAVSQYTKDKITEEYGIPGSKITVVHNGIQDRQRIKPARKNHERFRVLFLGRVTFQKGPDYFIDAALKVLAILPDTTFTLAGDGDMLARLRHKVKLAKAEDHFFMPGFLKGKDVDQAFADADLYVMPSVSEPFGISALEALYYNVPIIVSRQSGISEVIRHALKADFWDVDELANLIIGALKYPELGRDLLQMASQELRRLDWDTSAKNVIQVYQTVLGG